jgi:hypothetical protein
MHNIVFMTKSNSFNYLINEKSESLRVNADSIVFENLEQILLDILEDEIEPPLSFEGLFQKHDVFVFEKSQHFDLSHDSFLGDLIFI